MGITGVGSHYTYMYDANTNKLSTKEGTPDKFCDFFNGDLAENDYGELNGYDMKMKKDIESMIMLFNSGVQGANVFNPEEGLYEISTEIVQGDTAKYTVNGKHAFTGCVGIQYTKSQLTAFTDLQQSYRTTKPQKYNAEDNSINIAIGDIYNIGNGRKIIVENDWMHGIGFLKDNGEINEFNKYLDGINALMRVADGLAPSSIITADVTSYVLDFLHDQGVDTNKEFVINGTKMHVVNGRIREVGNKTGVPNNIYKQALARYEQWLYEPLADRNNYRNPVAGEYEK